MPLGDLHRPEALQFWVRGGVCKTCKRGALRQNILPGKWGGGRKMDLRFYTDSSIFNSFFTKGKEKKKMDLKKKKSNTWTRPLYSRGRQEYPQCVTSLARTAHSLAKKRASLPFRNTACPVRSICSPTRSKILEEPGWDKPFCTRASICRNDRT